VNSDQTDFTSREHLLDERERALLEREEELARQSREQSGSSTHEVLDRPPPLVAQGPRRSLAFLFVFLAALVFLGWVVLRGPHSAGKDISEDSIPFESRNTAGLNLDVPRSPEPVPGVSTQPTAVPASHEVADRVQSQEQELLLARQRAPILITQASPASPRTTAAAAAAFAPGEPPPLVAGFPSLDRVLVPDTSQMSAMTSRSNEIVDPNTRFQRQLGKSSAPTSVATQTPDRDFLILQGKFIDAVAETAINSDLPGQIRALVSHDIYAERGRRIMLPRGTRLLGEYNTAITKGQERLFVVWTRAIRPDGIDIALLSGGSDSLGRAGLSGEVDTHFWTIFGTSALLSVIGVGTATAGVNSGQDQLNSAAIYRAEIAESFNRSASRVLDKYLDIKPTIRIAHGEKLKVFVARDLDFTTALGAADAQDAVTVLR
jgi:type IV secretion system protein VirB10